MATKESQLKRLAWESCQEPHKQAQAKHINLSESPQPPARMLAYDVPMVELPWRFWTFRMICSTSNRRRWGSRCCNSQLHCLSMHRPVLDAWTMTRAVQKQEVLAVATQRCQGQAARRRHQEGRRKKWPEIHGKGNGEGTTRTRPQLLNGGASSCTSEMQLKKSRM